MTRAKMFLPPPCFRAMAGYGKGVPWRIAWDALL